MAKILAMVWYEILMGWRRGSSRVLLFVPALMPIIGFALFTSTTFSEEQLINSQISTELAQRMNTGMALMDNMFLIPIAMFLIPMLVAETIPLDRQYKMYEIVHALPISMETYLAGKVLTALIQAIVAVGVAGLINLAIQILRSSSIDVVPLTTFWVGGVLALIVVVATAGVLLPASQPNRRRAIFVGMAVALMSIGVYALLPLHEVMMISLIQTTALAYNPAVSISQLPAYPTPLNDPYLRNYTFLAAGLGLIWVFTVWRLRKSESIQ